MELANEAWVPASAIFGTGTEEPPKLLKKKHKRRHADGRRARTTIVGPGILPVAKHRKSVSSSQLPRQVLCSPTAGVWMIEPIVVS
jgi:hypothetical protein